MEMKLIHNNINSKNLFLTGFGEIKLIWLGYSNFNNNN